MPKTTLQLAKTLGIGAAALRDFLKRRGDLRCVDDEAVFPDDEARALAAAFALENEDAPNAGVVGMTVDRFKAFGTPQQVRLAPITLVFGQNSVGKSSFLHALLWAHHVDATGETDVQTPDLAGNSVHLGGFDNVLYRHDRTKPFTLSFDIQTPQLSAFLPERARFCARVSFGDRDARASAPHPERYVLAMEGEEILEAVYKKHAYTLRRVRLDHPIFETAFRRIARLSGENKKLSDDAVARMRAAARAVCRRVRLEGGRLLPRRVVLNGAPAVPNLSEPPAADDAERWARIVEASLPQFLHALVSGSAERVGDYLHALSYLGPLRAYPDRGFSLDDRSDPNWRAGGGRAWALLRESQSLRDAVNRFLGKDHLQTGYRFSLKRFVAAEDAAAALARHKSATPARLKHLLDDEALDHRDELVLTDLRNRMAVSHRDVGVGLSQVIPVLVFAANDERQTLIVEQPELHIHPALQADLGDVFIRSALERQNRFILETHSEHLMLRLLKRVRQSACGDPAYPKDLPKLPPEAVSVVYAKAEPEGTRLVPIPLTPDGDFAAPWPDGFFTERGHELFD